MAQSENTELRDLVIDALEKNGSLAKIRALLRANIFLAFEEDCENVKHNPSLDNILQMPEGLLSLSLIHEFLEYCNLRNTMFVYVSESRQGKEYKYEGRKRLAERFGNLKRELTKEPLLVTIIKAILTSQNAQDGRTKTKASSHKNGMKDDQNCTYIVHEDSSSVSSHGQSQSDNSSDEKNKLIFRLPIDNSDTDTSSDSTHTQEKTSSEYIANENIIVDGDSDDDSKKSTNGSPSHITESKSHINNSHDEFKTFSHNKSDVMNPHSSDSTSYIELQTNKLTLDKKFEMIGSRLQKNEINKKSTLDNQSPSVISPRNIIQSLSIKQEDIANKNVPEKINIDKSDIVPSDYSLDFSMSDHSSQNNNSNKESPIKDDLNMNGSSFINDSPRNETHSTRSSVSISDVNDLLDIDSPLKQHKDNKEGFSNLLKENQISKGKKTSKEESEDFSVSSVPSLSNLSLDLNSD